MRDAGHTDEFNCVDCNCPTVTFGYRVASRTCAGCSLLRQIDDKSERADLRKLFLERGIIGPLDGWET